MKKSTARLISVTAVLVLLLQLVLFLPTSAVSTDGYDDDTTVQAFEKKINELKSQANTIKKRLSTVKSDIKATEQQLQDLEDLKSITQERIELSRSMLEELRREEKDLEAEIENRSGMIESTFNSFLNRMRASYEDGDASYLELLMGAVDLSDFVSKWDYITALLQRDRTLMEKYRSEKTSLEAKKDELTATINKQKTTENAMEELMDELDLMKLDAEEALQALKKRYNSTNQEYQEIDERLDDINEELEKYLEELARQSQEEYSGEGMIWPLKGFRNISSYFGPRTYTYKGSVIHDNHTGIDISGSGIYGAEIRAVASGKVETATTHSSYGNYIIINHGGGIFTVYAHASKLLVKKGQEVKQGDVIALVGSTGKSTGAHLHFEVRVAGKAVDPIGKGYVVQPKK